jgi:DNA adenine methylase
MPDRQQDPQDPQGKPAPKIKPFLRWAGGKRQLKRILLAFLPLDVSERTYREPFLGGGSLFFALQPRAAILSDANKHLIKCYEFVRDQPEVVARHLRFHALKNTKAHYYRVREEYNNTEFSAAQAARFIYLNKTCFNGIFRVNAQGKFNVPYGWKESPAIPSDDDLIGIAAILKNASLKASSYEMALENASKGDFIYLDPPYPPLNGTAYFTHYTIDRFSVQDQTKLADCVNELDRGRCLFMISNADTPLIRRLYRKYELVSLPVIRYLTCKSARHKVKELIITNYEVQGETPAKVVNRFKEHDL